jgi:hypothetical protein
MFNQSQTIFYLLLYTIFYHLCYNNCINPNFEYTGFYYTEFSYVSYALNLVNIICFALTNKTNITTQKSIVRLILLICLVIPTNLYFVAVREMHSFDEWLFIIVFNSCYLSLALFTRHTEKGTKSNSREVTLQDEKSWLKDYSIICKFYTGMLFLFMLYLTKLQFNFSFQNAYDRRMLSRETLNGPISYLHLSALTVIFPLCITYFWSTKNYKWLTLTFAVPILEFSFKASKGFLFSPILFLFIIWLIENKVKIAKLIRVCAIFMLICWLEGFIKPDAPLSNYIVRRMVSVPALLTSNYYDTFENMEKNKLQNTQLNSLFLHSDKHKLPVSRLIGERYFGSEHVNANANFIASGFAEFGYFGIILSCLLAFIILENLNIERGFYAKRLSIYYTSAFAILLTQGSIHTSLLSNGIILQLFVIYVIKIKQNYVSKDYLV